MKRSQLDLEKRVMLDHLGKQFERFKLSRPVVDTGLGYAVQGGYQDAQNLEGARDLEMPYVRAADNSVHSVTATDWETILSAVKAHAAQRFQRKWTIEDEIKAAPDLDTLRAIDTSL